MRRRRLAAQHLAGTFDLKRVQVTQGDALGGLTTPVQRRTGHLGTLEHDAVQRHAVLAHPLLEQTCRRAVRLLQTFGTRITSNLPVPSGTGNSNTSASMPGRVPS